MPRRTQNQWSRCSRGTAIALFVVALAAGFSQTALAIRHGGPSNTPLPDPGWPKGTAAVFNSPARIAYWIGPDAGYYTAEFRGDARSLSTVLADFVNLDVRTKRLIVHDGVGRRTDQGEMDWALDVWVPALWQRPQGGAFSMEGTVFFRAPDQCPAPRIDVYADGNVRWSDVIVPEGIEVSDERLEAHGFTPADGIVLEGKVVDLTTRKPLAAKMRLERIEQDPNGKRNYTTVAEAAADAQGRWVLKNAPEGWYRVVVMADGYVPRWVDNFSSKPDVFRDQPGWHAYHCGLSRPAVVSGRVIDDAGKPLADVEVSLDDVSGGDGHYGPTHEYVSTSDAEGRFRLEQVPAGSATIRARKTGYCLPGAGKPITTPATDVSLNMAQSAIVRVTVDFAGTNRPETYIAAIVPFAEPQRGSAGPTWEQLRNLVTLTQPKGEAAVGLWVEIRIVDANDQVCFKGVPPGKYVLQGWPSRYGSGGRETPFTGVSRSKPLTIDLKSGETAEVTLAAK